MHEQQLRAIHAQACAAVALVDRTITPIDERFWPLYLSAALAAAETNHWEELYEDAMKTLAPAFDYIQSHAEQFNGKPGDSKLAIIAAAFPRLAAAAIVPQAPALTDEQRSNLAWALEVASSSNRGGYKTIESLRLLFDCPATHPTVVPASVDEHGQPRWKLESDGTFYVKGRKIGGNHD